MTIEELKAKHAEFDRLAKEKVDKEERERIEAENSRLKAENSRLKAEAERKEAEIKAERAKADYERKEAEEKARKEKNASDVEKFENIALLISNIKMPDVNSDESKKLNSDVNIFLTKVVNHINFRLQSL